MYEDPMTGTMAGPTESPFVFAHDGHYYLLIGPDWAEVLALYLRNEPILGAAHRRTAAAAAPTPALRAGRSGRHDRGPRRRGGRRRRRDVLGQPLRLGPGRCPPKPLPPEVLGGLAPRDAP
ncbi:MAG: hypothetical protein R2705_19395 [Ilumatobacteraceae bacterium]